ncbi:MAG: adenylate/guanylate cyclase domain-containing protein [Acidimicrobiales bacterium]|nr:adenylate/guanylate cyclase domain-containing protein [Acidimicrobiales bacterium]
MTAHGCPACGATPPPSARFCPSCGVSLGAVATGERRVVTVAFADLAGFTTMAEGRDPEAVKELLDSCFGVLVPVIEAHGGTVDKIIGDELMAVWGAPRAHEDDPERAVRAALALLEALDRMDGALEMRVGINTGEVLAGPVGPGGAYTVTGDTVNTAHRLVGVAERGTVLVGERTHLATRAAIAFGPPTSRVLRGRREPVVAHPALRTRHRPGERLAPGRLTPMLGRDEELAELVGTVADAASGHGPWLVSVVGEAGLGKTRLVSELGPALRRRGLAPRLVVANCAPYGSEGPLAPLSAVLRATLGVDDDLPAAAQRAAVEARIAELGPSGQGDRRYLTQRTLQLLGLTDLPDAPPIDAGPARSRLANELTTAARLVLEAAADHEPLVVLLDDAHFADVAVLEVLERLGSSSDRRPLAVIVVGRDELMDLRPRLTTRQGMRHAVLRLQPLDAASSHELLYRTLAGMDQHMGTLAPRPEAQILAAAGGNPLLLDQLVRFLRETGSLEVVEGGWRAVRDLHEAGLPDDARALLGARLDGLPSGERAVLHGAAIVGRSFTPSAVRALGVTVDDDVLEDLARRGLLVTEDGAPDEPALAFRHAMVRDAAYASVPLGERATKHALVATWLLDGAAGRVDDAHIAEIAHHVERAVALGGELGHPGPTLSPVANGFLVRAARAARQRDETAEAARWYQRARELRLVDDGDEVEVALEHGATLLALRRLADAHAVLTGVLQMVGNTDPAASGEAHTGLGLVARLLGDTDRASACFEAGRQAWEEAGDLAGEAGSVRTHGWAELVAGRPGAALPKLLRARELDERTGRPRGITLQCLAWSEFLVGEHAAARGHIWEAARELSADEDRVGLSWCFEILGNSLWQEGRVAQARHVAENLLAAGRGLGDPWGGGSSLVLLAGCQLEAGDVEAARQCTAAALRTFAELDDLWGEANARLVQGMAERVSGDLGAARVALERGLAIAQQVVSLGAEARLRAELAATLLDAGDETGGAREARRTLTLVRSGGGDRDSEIRALVVLAKRARDLADDPDAGRLLEEAIALAAGDVRTSIWRRAVAWSAIIAAESGAVDRAHRLAAEALSGSWESARTWVLAQRAVAAAQRAEGNTAGALATLDAVLGRFRDRPLAFLDVIRNDIRALEPAQGNP